MGNQDKLRQMTLAIVALLDQEGISTDAAFHDAIFNTLQLAYVEGWREGQRSVFNAMHTLANSKTSDVEKAIDKYLEGGKRA